MTPELERIAAHFPTIPPERWGDPVVHNLGCPLCGKTELRVHVDMGGAWMCGSCDRCGTAEEFPLRSAPEPNTPLPLDGLKRVAEQNERERRAVVAALMGMPDEGAPEAAFDGEGENEPIPPEGATASPEQAHSAPKRKRGPSSSPPPADKGASGSIVVSAAELFARKFDPPVFVVEGLLANGMTLLAARPKAGKSWLTLQLALSTAKGEPFLGQFQVRAGMNILYYALEEPATRTHHRLHKLTGQDIGLERIRFVYRIEPLMAGGASQIDTDLSSDRFDLVILDTLAAVLQPNARRDPLRSEYAEANTLRQLAEKHKTCILVVAHSRKAEADYALDAVAGTTGMTAGSDAVWVLKRQKDGTSILDTIGRETEESAYRLSFGKNDPFGWRLLGEGATARLTPARTQLLATLSQMGSATSKQLAERLEKSQPAICNLLDDLSREGLVLRSDESDPPRWSTLAQP